MAGKYIQYYTYVYIRAKYQVDRNNFWLVPEYTTIADDACTSFQISIQPGYGRSTYECRIPTETAWLHVNAMRDHSIIDKISELAIVRIDAKSVDLSTLRDYSGMSSHIWRSKDGQSTLHLVWKTRPIIQ